MFGFESLKDYFMNSKFYYNGQEPKTVWKEVRFDECVRLRVNLYSIFKGEEVWRKFLIHNKENDYYAVCMPAEQLMMDVNQQ